MKQNLFKKTVRTNHEDIKNHISFPANSIDIFALEEPTISDVDVESKEPNNRLKDLDNYLSDDQKKHITTF